MNYAKKIGKISVFLLITALIISTATFTILPSATAAPGVTEYPWPMGGHDPARTGYTDAPAPKTNETRWVVNATGSTDPFRTGVAVANGTVYLGSDDNYLYALDQLTGETKWKTNLGDDVRCAPAVSPDGTKVYITSKNGSAFCLNTADGSTIWAVQISTSGEQNSAPVVSPDGTKVVVGAYNGSMFCLDAANGNTIWSNKLGTRVRVGAAIEGDRVYAGAADESSPNRVVRCYDLETGAIIWNSADIGSSTYGGYVVVYDKYVFVASQGANKVLKLNKTDGTLIMTYWLANRPQGGLAVAYGNLYVCYGYSTATYGVAAFDINTDTLKWNFTYSGAAASYNVPAVADGMVFVLVTDGYVYALNATTTNSAGEVIWKYNTGTTPAECERGSGAVVDGCFIVGAGDGMVYCFGPSLYGVTEYPWPMGGHDPARTGYTDAPAPKTNQTSWKFDTGTASAFRTGVAVANGTVYLGSDDDSLYALDMVTGAKKWNTSLGGDVRATPAVSPDGKKVYIASNNGSAFCLNTADGSTIWAVTIGSSTYDLMSSPAVADGKVVIGSNNGTLFCLNADTGEVIWRTTQLGSRIRAGVAIEGDRVYVTGEDQYVRCFNLTTGDPIWQTESTMGSAMYAGYVIVSGDYVFAVSQGNRRVWKLNKTDGTGTYVDLTGTIGSTAMRGGLAVAYGNVYVVYSYGVACIDIDTLTIEWTYSVTGATHCLNVPVVADGIVFVLLTDGYVYALNATTTNSAGEVIWKYNTGTTTTACDRAIGAVADGCLFIGAGDGKVFCFAPVPRRLYTDPAAIVEVYNICESFTVQIKVENITDLWSYGIALEWNASVLECTGVTYVDTLLPDTAQYPDYYTDTPGAYDNDLGKFTAPYCRALTSPNTKGVDGSGTLMNVTFHVKDYGKTWINFITGTRLNNSLLQEITVPMEGCWFKLTPPPPPRRDVAIVSIEKTTEIATGVFSSAPLGPAANKTLWIFDTGSPDAVRSSPAVVGGTVYIGSDNNTLFAIDMVTGTLKWKYIATGDVRSAPAVADGKVFFTDRSGNLTCLSATTGGYLWHYRADGVTESRSSPTIYNNGTHNIVIWGTRSNQGYPNVFARTTNNEPVWEFMAGTQSGDERIEGKPAVASNGTHTLVFVGGYYTDTLFAIDLATGQQAWTYNAGSDIIRGPVVADGLVFVAPKGKGVMAFYLNGTQKWVNSGPQNVYGGVTVAYGKVYVTGTGNGVVWCLNASTGETIWTKSTGAPGGNWYGIPVVADGLVFFITYGGVVYALDANNGYTVWTYDTGATADEAYGAVADGCLFIGSGPSGETSKVYCFGDPKHGSGVTNYPWPQGRHDAANTGYTTATAPGRAQLQAFTSWKKPITIKVTVENQGDIPENFTVTVYANSTPVAASQNVNNLAPGANITLTFIWDHRSVNPPPKESAPVFTITATATITDAEDNDPIDNSASDGTVTVKHAGDTEGDGKVYTLDFSKLVTAYREGTKPEYPYKTCECDFDGDEKVYTLDFSVLVTNYRWGTK
jgi:outer membrane protein assembly factor BamB